MTTLPYEHATSCWAVVLAPTSTRIDNTTTALTHPCRTVARMRSVRSNQRAADPGRDAWQAAVPASAAPPSVKAAGSIMATCGHDPECAALVLHAGPYCDFTRRPGNKTTSSGRHPAML